MITSFGGDTSCQTIAAGGIISSDAGVAMPTDTISEISAEPYDEGASADIIPTQLAVKTSTDDADAVTLGAANAYSDMVTLHDFPLPVAFTGLDASTGITIHGPPGSARTVNLTYKGGAYDLSAKDFSVDNTPVVLRGFAFHGDVIASRIEAAPESLFDQVDRLGLQLYTIPGVAGPTLTQVGACYVHAFAPGVKQTIFGVAPALMCGGTVSDVNAVATSSGTSQNPVSFTLKLRSYSPGGNVNTLAGRTATLTMSSDMRLRPYQLGVSFANTCNPRSMIIVSFSRNVDTNPDTFYLSSIVQDFYVMTWGAESTAI